MRRAIAGALAALAIAVAPAGAASFSPQAVDLWGPPFGDFLNPAGVAVDPAGDFVYVADTGDDRIVELTTSGTYVDSWGTYGHGQGRFNGPVAIATDGYGDVYVADRGDNIVQKFSGSGRFLRQWPFAVPRGIATDRAGHVFGLSDQYNRVHEWTADGRDLAAWTATMPGNYFPGVYADPSANDVKAIAVANDGTVLVGGDAVQSYVGAHSCEELADFNPAYDFRPYPNPLVSGEVARYTAAGAYLGTGWLSRSPKACIYPWESQGMPAGLAVDRAGGQVYAALPFGPVVRPLGADRADIGLPCLQCQGGTYVGPPQGVAIDCRGNLYVTVRSAVLRYRNLDRAPRPPCPARLSHNADAAVSQFVHFDPTHQRVVVGVGCLDGRCRGDVAVYVGPPGCAPHNCYAGLAGKTLTLSRGHSTQVSVGLGGAARKVLAHLGDVRVSALVRLRGHRRPAARLTGARLRQPEGLSLGCSATSAVFDVLALSGRTSPVLRRAPVSLLLGPPAGIATMRTVRTDGRGRFHLRFTPGLSGSWSAQALYAGTRLREPARSRGCATKVAPVPTTLAITSCASAGAMSPASVAGALAPAVAGARIELVYTRAGASAVLTEASADADGRFTDAPVLAAGTWSVVARWPGDARHPAVTSAPCSFSSSLTPTSLGIECPRTPALDPVRVFGQLTPGFAGAPVTVTVVDGTGDRRTATATTVDDGDYEADFGALRPLGFWTAQATWPGDAAHAGATSDSCRFDNST
jgi:hypothetical protein